MLRVTPILLGLSLLLLLALPVTAQESFPRSTLSIETAGGETHAFEIEVARTNGQMVQGLMYRQELAADAGMLFVYAAPRMVSMWMKNTILPLDMLFIGRDGRIVRIAERTVPYSTATISSRRPVRSVLELNGGTAARLGIAVGDRVSSPALDK